MTSFDRDKVTVAIRERAETDSEFRALLLTDPPAAISELLGIPVPGAVRFSVHEESPTDIHLVIPAVSSLSDEDLTLIEGAGDWSVVTHIPACSCW
jgi:hypothetical protein